jgi:KipI family sensor histidine kinase inhibitor
MTKEQLPKIKFLPCGDTALSIEFGREVDPLINAMVMAFDEEIHRLHQRGELDALIETIPSFRAILLTYNPLKMRQKDIVEKLQSIPVHEAQARQPTRIWHIPTCYDREFGLDLDDVAERCNQSVQQVIDLHSQADFQVYMLGFMPGLGYLGGLPDVLELPRRSEPRVAVPLGSVAIAGKMSVIYPWESPGGWHILGRTPVPLFDQKTEKPVLLSAGDGVRFKPVSREEFDDLNARIVAGQFSLKELEG